jgi:hypothetical protein
MPCENQTEKMTLAELFSFSGTCCFKAAGGHRGYEQTHLHLQRKLVHHLLLFDAIEWLGTCIALDCTKW